MKNKIHLGDSYQLIKEIPSNSIDCVYIDVPYLYNQGGSGASELGERTAKKRLELMGASQLIEDNPSMSYGELLKLAKKNKECYKSIEDGMDYNLFSDLIRVMKKVNCFIWCSKLQILDIMNWFNENTTTHFEIMVWKKDNPTPSTNNSWLPDLEYCLYFRGKGVKLNDGYELKSKWYASPINKKDKDLYDHPTIKPLELVKRHLLHSTQENDVVLDCFSGSGTTCVACQETNRQFIGIEIDENYHKISVDRLNGISARDRECRNKGAISIFDIIEEQGVKK